MQENVSTRLKQSGQFWPLTGLQLPSALDTTVKDEVIWNCRHIAPTLVLTYIQIIFNCCLLLFSIVKVCAYTVHQN